SGADRSRKNRREARPRLVTRRTQRQPWKDARFPTFECACTARAKIRGRRRGRLSSTRSHFERRTGIPIALEHGHLVLRIAKRANGSTAAVAKAYRHEDRGCAYHSGGDSLVRCHADASGNCPAARALA